MTPSERERRIDAATRAWSESWFLSNIQKRAELTLDAADEAVPVVPATWDGLLEHLDAMYPADVFSGESGDIGAQLVALARKLAGVEAEVKRLRGEIQSVCGRAERNELDRDRWKGVYENYRDDAEESIARAEAAARDVAQQLRSEVHGLLQTLRGCCADEDDYRLIDHKLAFVDEVVHGLAERLSPSFSGEEGTGP